MTFLVTYKISPDHRNAATERFKQGGGPPPKGVKMLNRYHKADGSGGLVICESDDVIALGRWTQEWADLLQFETTPVLDDQQFTTLLGG